MAELKNLPNDKQLRWCWNNCLIIQHYQYQNHPLNDHLTQIVPPLYRNTVCPHHIRVYRNKMRQYRVRRFQKVPQTAIQCPELPKFNRAKEVKS